MTETHITQVGVANVANQCRPPCTAAVAPLIQWNLSIKVTLGTMLTGCYTEVDGGWWCTRIEI